jgi:RNA recognition motif-containing protein
MQADRGFAFVKLDTHQNAAMAIVNLQNQLVHGRPVKCSWGKDRQSGEGSSSQSMMQPQPGGPAYPGLVSDLITTLIEDVRNSSCQRIRSVYRLCRLRRIPYSTRDRHSRTTRCIHFASSRWQQRPTSTTSMGSQRLLSATGKLGRLLQ